MTRPKPASRTEAKLKIGVSSCLLGQNVRYDGGHKRDDFLTRILGPHVEWVQVCPELEVGMGVPREPVALMGTPASARMVGIETGKDWTVRMLSWSERMSATLPTLDLCGYILKSRSPSCGPSGVRLVNAKGRSSNRGTGLFARALVRKNPLLPVEEEGLLDNPVRRDDFIVRMFAYRRLRAMLDAPFDPEALSAFHSTEEWLLRARSPRLCQELTALVRGLGAEDIRGKYAPVFMRCLATESTVGKNLRILLRIAALFPQEVGSKERREVAKAIEAYREGRKQLFLPLGLFRTIAREYPDSGLSLKSYLVPDENEWNVRVDAASA